MSASWSGVRWDPQLSEAQRSRIEPVRAVLSTAVPFISAVSFLTVGLSGASAVTFAEQFLMQRRHPRFRMLQQQLNRLPILEHGVGGVAFRFVEFSVEFKHRNRLWFDRQNICNQQIQLSHSLVPARPSPSR